MDSNFKIMTAQEARTKALASEAHLRRIARFISEVAGEGNQMITYTFDSVIPEVANNIIQTLLNAGYALKAKIVDFDGEIVEVENVEKTFDATDKNIVEIQIKW